LELRLKKLPTTTVTMKQSKFRKLLIDNCHSYFEKFFSAQESTESNIFKTRLMNNIRFIGELYRRKLLHEPIIFSVFEMLLGE
jgi:hypothetical protein